MANIIPVMVPKETVSDDLYLVVELCFESGEKVKQREIIGYLETSKSSIDVEAPVSGYVFYNAEEGQEIPIGFVFAAISSHVDIPSDYFEKFQQEIKQKQEALPDSTMSSDIRISKAARELIHEYNLDASVFQGITILRSEDVKKYLQSKKFEETKVEIAHSIIPTSKGLIIVGGGGQTKMCIDILQQMRAYEINGIVSSILQKGAHTLGVPVIGNENDLEQLYKDGILFAVVGFGSLDKPILRQKMFDKLKRIGFILPNLIHPAASIEPSATLGDGNQIMAGAIVGSDVKIGNNCIVNSGSIVSHDSVLMDNVHITPGAILAGVVKVGSNTIVGMGATIFMYVNVGSNVIINNGINLFKDVPDGTIVKK